MYVDLDRRFIALSSDEEATEWAEFLDLPYGRSLNWAAMLTRPRVVLLAEAGCGKTEEFKHQAGELAKAGQFAFFVRVEDLAVSELNDALNPGDEAQFAKWRDGGEHAWFFLDSVDEARLAQHSFERALKRLRRDVGAGLDRASILVSCRVSDWRGRSDRLLVQELLPVLTLPDSQENIEKGDGPLLDAVIGVDGASDSESVTDDQLKSAADAVTVVRLAALGKREWERVAKAAGVEGVSEFSSAIEQQGLEVFAERPKDLLDLIDYWKVHGRFGRLAEMTRFGIFNKLAERDHSRPDSDVISEQQARAGAERVAAVMTLGKSATLRAPAQEPDPTLAAGALEPAAILPDWSPAQRAALLRRAMFAPATYGRLRFHHRSTQEYLTAEWLTRMRNGGCPEREVHSLLFAERYGVETVVPSMRAVAAWLAIDHPDIRREVVRREPLLLIRHGDPQSLPPESKAEVLRAVVARHRAGAISDKSVDRRAVWMFANPDLASTVRDVWTAASDEMRTLLIELIGQGRIAACVDLVRFVALDANSNPYDRYLALKAMEACNDGEGLSAAAELVASGGCADKQRSVVNFARVLYPRWISRDVLVRLIAETPESDRAASDGFVRYLPEIWRATAEDERMALLEQVADICLQPPFAADWERVSAMHRRTVEGLVPIAIEVLQTAHIGVAPPGLLKACAAIERARPYSGNDKRRRLSELVSGNSPFNEQLFWFDVLEAQRSREKKVTFVWQLGVGGHQLWSLSVVNAEWLLERVAAETDCQLRRIALSAYVERVGVEVVRRQAVELQAMVSGSADLERDLSGYLQPPQESPESAEHRQRMRLNEERRSRDREAARTSWTRFAERLRSDSSHLRDPSRIVAWEFARDFVLLTNWLQSKTKKDRVEACRHWHLLVDGFGGQVAEAYRDGMCLLWRLRSPGAPVRSVPGQPVTHQWLDLLAFFGVGLEASVNEAWATRLTPTEAEQAVRHALCVDERSPDWMERLVIAHPERLVPILANEARAEWIEASQQFSQVLHRIVDGSDAYFALMADVLTALLEVRPARLENYDVGLRGLRRLEGRQRSLGHLAEAARRAYGSAMVAGYEAWAVRQLALWCFFEPEAAVAALEDSINRGAASETFAETAFGVMFGDDHPVFGGLVQGWPVRLLHRLTVLSFACIRPEDDVEHEGVYSPSRRDNAESARGALLKALMATPGRETYEALRDLASRQQDTSRQIRYLGLAHERAESDAELERWQPPDVVRFEKSFAAPVRTGESLFCASLGVLSDIQRSLVHDDASSRPLLQKATDEDEVQVWLAEQLRLRSRGRYHVHREVEVADDNKPDIALSSTDADVEVAVEIKHGGKDKWTVSTLRNAIEEQLVDKYLRPANRRHGVFVISHHRAERRWRDPDSGVDMTFDGLIERLSLFAASLKANVTGPITVRVVGLDATPKKGRVG